MSNLKHSFLFNLILVLLICLALYIILFFALHQFTHHGEEVVLPNVTGQQVSTAIAELEELHFGVSIDSAYEPALKPFTVLKQSPDSNAIVKEGRTVFLTINRQTPPNIPMPDLVTLSFKSALTLLQNNRLILGDTLHKPFIKAGVILQQYYRGYPVIPGSMIAMGSKINLEVGDGLGNTEITMPGVTDINCEMALAILSQLDLQITIVAPNDSIKITDTLSAMVIGQTPKPGTTIKNGDKILLTARN